MSSKKLYHLWNFLHPPNNQPQLKQPRYLWFWPSVKVFLHFLYPENKTKKIVRNVFSKTIFEIELMVWGRTKIVEKILQKINCVSSCSKMGANIYSTLKKGDKFCPTSSSKNNYSLEKCRFSTVKSNRKSTFNTWM